MIQDVWSVFRHLIAQRLPGLAAGRSGRLLVLLSLIAPPLHGIAATLEFDNDGYLVSEAAKSFTVGVTLDAPDCSGQVVLPADFFNLETVESNGATGGSAPGNGADFFLGRLGSDGYLPGGTSNPPVPVTITIGGAIFDDRIYEGTESFFLQIVDLKTAQCVTPSATIDLDVSVGPPATVEIDDDEPLPEISIDDVTVVEGDSGTTMAGFAVTLSLASQQEVKVSFATEDGTAVSQGVAAGTPKGGAADYQATTGTLTFPPGSTSERIEVPVHGDLRDEEDETFLVNLFEPAGAALADEHGQGTIEDDDFPALTIDDVTVKEGDEGTVTATFTARLSAASDFHVSAMYETVDGTAVSRQRAARTEPGVDYQPTSGEIAFPPDTTTATIDVLVHGDRLVEDDEDFFVQLSEAVNASLEDPRGRGLILDDDEPPSITIDDARAREGTEAVFTVLLSRASDRQVSVHYANRDRDAASTGPRPDYRSVNDVLVFAPGETSMKIAVQLLDDDRDEKNETFVLRLDDPRNAVLGDDTGVGTILDDDRVPAIAIDDVSKSEGDEGTTPFRFQVSLSAPSERTVSVDYRVRKDTADRHDFSPGTGSVTFSPGQTQRRLTVEVLGDTLVEDDELFRVALSRPVNATLEDSEGLGTIRNDDDNPPSEIRVVSGDGQTGLIHRPLDDPLEVEVVGTEGPIPDVTVAWQVAGGEAALGDATTTTDDAGRSTNTVILGARSGDLEIRASVEGVDEPAVFTVHARVVRTTSGLGETEGSVATALNVVCARDDLSADLRRICDELAGTAHQGAALRALAPEEAATQGTVSLEAQRTQFRNVGARLAAVRSGIRASSQLVLNLGGVPLPGSVLAGLLAPSEKRDLDVDRLLRRQAARDGILLHPGLQDAASAPAAAGTSDLGGRWGFFVNGTIGEGGRSATDRESGFDFDTAGLTAGVDYRLRDGLTVGAALGYLSDDVELRSDGGAVDIEGYSLSLYGTWYRSRLYLDGIISYGWNDFDTRRGIDFLGRRLTARGQPDGSLLSASLGLGYDVPAGSWTVGGYGRLDYVDTDIDAFRETGAPGFNLAIGDQQIESLLSQLGIQVTYAAGLSWGVLSPTLRLGALHELRDDSRPLRSFFVDDPGSTAFTIFTDDPDRDYFNLGLGVSAVFKHGRQAFVFYEKDLKRDDLNAYLITAGLRLEL